MRPASWTSFLAVLGMSGLLLGAAPAPPKNPHGTLDTDCGECHSPNRWVPVLPRPHFVHDKTGFPLQGAHAQASCRSCHKSLVFAHVATSCSDCHRDPHNHELGTQCEKCHTPRTWTNQSEIFRAHNRTRFPLFAVHATVDCARCHQNQKPQEYVTTPTTCGACHLKNYLAAQHPNHAQSSFSTRCEDCHSMTASAWKTTRFTDHSLTRFPLAGAHLAVACERCHPGGRFSGTSLACYSCHQSNYQGTSNPNHVAGNFPHTCDSCHSVNGWRPASQTDHNKTRFPLTGAHRAVDCARCHVGGRYAGTPLDCYSCHRDKYQATSKPNHGAAGFPTQCESCHSTNSWTPATFDHNRTRFPLSGAHAKVDCARCHVGGRYAGTATDCYSCHRANYDGTSNPNHQTSGFPTTCGSCHSTNGWRPATSIDHNTTRFPLTGAHQRVDCTRCHVGGKYAGTSTDCYSCHRANYDGTSNPSHKAAGFATSCESCHSTNAWRPASFDHNKSRFPLTGAHKNVDCTRCHPGGKYAGTPTACYSCHKSNYDGTTNPNHAGAGFPTNCDSCHTTSGWKPATFDHDGRYFPIYSGKHRGKWSSCSDCHKNAGNYKAFECILCHSNKSKIDSDHKDVKGYTYSSQACYKCHPRGSS